MTAASGREAYRGIGQLEDPPTDASFFTRRHLNYPPFTSARPPKELRGGHNTGVRALAWNATGDVLMSCGSDHVVRAWNPERSSDVRATTEFTGHSGQISAIACHPTDPHLFATGGIDRTVRVWDLRAPSSTKVISTPGSNINLAYHPQGRFLAVGDKSETVSLIDADQGCFLHKIKDGSIDREEINELAWSPDGSMLLLPMGSGTISFLRAPDTPELEADASTAANGLKQCWEQVMIHHAHPAAIFCVKWDPTERVVATAAADSTLALWDSALWDCSRVFSDFKFPLRTIDFSFDGEWLAVGGEDPDVALDILTRHLQISLAGERIVHRIPVSTTINSLAWHPSKPMLAYSGTDTSTSLGPGIAATTGRAATTPVIWVYSIP
ncbi:hypothetical protein MGL_0782 [Malassezia globosa CBS 7966]|uniref:Uncharacterized protein n=1 Tax=Malassezia globosa (strain ATCC MYA-4612 / CBS 7966) TaxID=425265 RepID=A8PUV7_MALGO|nr:uncharacterized protein MGL_0782 [Malassezia globosa CBS 7966]EDP44975.1 hypothetical protein MGL_0782 [Malassezia globosa CBS 7966]